MKWICMLVLALCVGCGGTSFLVVSFEAPPNTIDPRIDLLEVTITAVVDDVPVRKVLEFEVVGQSLPLSFGLEFLGRRGGLEVNLALSGLKNGVEVMHGEGSGIVGKEATITAFFCGDLVVSPEDGETCDDGVQNSDTAPDSCRTSCQLFSCGDGILDSNEICDDGNTIADDGCDPGCVASVVQISTGGSHTCALTRSGKVRCWGNGSSGQLGYSNVNNIGDDETPASAGFVDVGGVVTQIATGANHTCALLATANNFESDVRCWGLNSSGQLGLGNTENVGDDETPASVSRVFIVDVVQIVAGGNHTCALRSTGEVQCWGEGDFGQLGYGNTNDIGDNEIIGLAGFVDLGGTATQITAGANHTCALLDTGNVRCWGANFEFVVNQLNFIDGRLGYISTSNVGDDETPSSVGNVDVGGAVTQIRAGRSHTCALLDTGDVRCWGAGKLGQLGYGNVNNIGDNEPPSDAGNVNVGSIASQITTGDGRTCALLTTGAVRCWGEAGFFNSAFVFVPTPLGYGNTNNIGDNETPASAGDVNVAESTVQIATGGLHICALLTTGAVCCWGNNTFGQLGYGNIDVVGDDETPASAGNILLF